MINPMSFQIVNKIFGTIKLKQCSHLFLSMPNFSIFGVLFSEPITTRQRLVSLTGTWAFAFMEADAFLSTLKTPMLSSEPLPMYVLVITRNSYFFVRVRASSH